MRAIASPDLITGYRQIHFSSQRKAVVSVCDPERGWNLNDSLFKVLVRIFGIVKCFVSAHVKKQKTVFGAIVPYA